MEDKTARPDKAASGGTFRVVGRLLMVEVEFDTSLVTSFLEAFRNLNKKERWEDRPSWVQNLSYKLTEDPYGRVNVVLHFPEDLEKELMAFFQYFADKHHLKFGR